jgi:uncharacterized protein (UPF0303 family)
MDAQQMTVLSAIEALQQQEQALVLDRFDEETAHLLGLALRSVASERAAPVVIDIRSAARRYFYAALPGSSADNEDWARRKGNVTLRLHASSYLVQLRLEAQGRQPWPDAALPTQEYAAHGGAFPVRVKGCGVVAAIAVSGLPSHQDHDMIVSVLSRHLALQNVPETPAPSR